jgi:hypothetical protein
MMLTVVFYQASTSRVPVLEWLRDLGREDRKRIGADLLRVQENGPIGMPVWAPDFGKFAPASKVGGSHA